MAAPDLCQCDLSWQLSALFCGADGGQTASAFTGRIGFGMDHLPGFLSDHAAAGISAGPLAGDVISATDTGRYVSGITGVCVCPFACDQPSLASCGYRASGGECLPAADPPDWIALSARSEEHTSELQSQFHLVC